MKLINASDLLRHRKLKWLQSISVAELSSIISKMPSIDATPVIHAHWHRTDAYPHWLCCSNCNHKFLPNDEWVETYNIPTNYCPHCGAKMDEKEKE